MENIKFTHYGEVRDLNATDEEKEIFLAICEIVSEAGQDPKLIEFCRKSDSYVTASIGPHDIARFKFTPRAKWVQLPYSADERGKRPIESPVDVRQWSQLVMAHYHLAYANKLLGY